MWRAERSPSASQCKESFWELLVFLRGCGSSAPGRQEVSDRAEGHRGRPSMSTTPLSVCGCVGSAGSSDLRALRGQFMVFNYRLVHTSRGQTVERTPSSREVMTTTMIIMIMIIGITD